MAVSTRRHPVHAAAPAALPAITAAGGCAHTDNPTTPAITPTAASHQPVATTDTDWKPVTDALAHTGKLGDDNTAYHISLVRTDLQVTPKGCAWRALASSAGDSAANIGGSGRLPPLAG
ncbi:hypothetical protein [Nocardia sp. R7R-8]|uniref:hypothetical protein n=1 Tax=Nocardia sp. R7R-8 TaxID=3459304 RepID=UPI00403DE9B1